MATSKWNLRTTAEGPFEMRVQGRNTIVIRDVAVGEVWLASGQSNMAAMLKNSAAAEIEIARSADPLFREFHVDGSAADGVRGRWSVAGPQASGGFSAIGYYFAKSLRHALQRPVGIINAARPGTPIEAWLSGAAISEDPELAAGSRALAQVKAAYPGAIASFRRELTGWIQSCGRKDPACPNPGLFAAPGISTRDWVSVVLPGKVAGSGLPEFGAVWVRKEIEVPATLIGETMKIQFGVIEGFDAVYWNGTKIAETPPEKFPGANYRRYFVIPPALLKPGPATIAVRIFAPAAPPAFTSPSGSFWVGPIDLRGAWLAKGEFALPPPTAAMSQALPRPPANFTGMSGGELFDSLIAPLKDYRLAGFLWYQGESNTGRAFQYRRAFPLLINDWRRHWHAPDLPFYFCQLANYLPKRPNPSESGWSELREAQSMAAALPNTGQAVLIDLGESDDIHPRNKKEAGERLARWALAKDYGQTNLPFSGPVYDSAIFGGGAVRVKFREPAGGLTAKPLPAAYDVKVVLGLTAPLVRNSPGSPLEGFSICGADRTWVWADARIEGDSVLVRSDKVSAPVAVRYAWADNPTCNLYNAAGLPASPFRSDDFPCTTATAKFGLKADGKP